MFHFSSVWTARDIANSRDEARPRGDYQIRGKLRKLIYYSVDETDNVGLTFIPLPTYYDKFNRSTFRICFASHESPNQNENVKPNFKSLESCNLAIIEIKSNNYHVVN